MVSQEMNSYRRFEELLWELQPVLCETVFKILYRAMMKCTNLCVDNSPFRSSVEIVGAL